MTISCEKALCDSMLSMHNYYRSFHQVGDLILDTDMSNNASEFAARLVRENSFYNSGLPSIGENLVWRNERRRPVLTDEFCSGLACKKDFL